MDSQCTEEITQEEPEEMRKPNLHSPTILVCNSVKDVEKLSQKRSRGRSIQCEECNKKFATSRTLQTHKLQHMSRIDMPFKCMLCSFRAPAKAGLLRHSTTHGPRNLQCPHCDKKFHNHTYLSEHVSHLHQPEVILKCAQCDFETTRKRAMKDHIGRHLQAPACVSCPICDSVFQTKFNLQTHLLSHTGDKQFACDQCDKRFSRPNRVKAHKQVVHGPKEYECNQCVKTFPTSHHLQRHCRTHSGERPFKCCFCSFTSTTQSNLTKHARNVHSKTHFTYKDVKKQLCGEQEAVFSKAKMASLKKKGKIVVEDFLKKRLENSNVVPVSLQQLQTKAKRPKNSNVVIKPEVLDELPTDTSNSQYYIQLPENYYNLQCIQKGEQECFERVSIPQAKSDLAAPRVKVQNGVQSLCFDQQIVLFDISRGNSSATV